MPEISVIIPVYNGEQYIARPIKSAIYQGFKDIEVIVVDDGSTDRTAEIARQLAASDSRIKVISRKHEGVSAARNAGVDAASGRYVTFVDADDGLYKFSLQYLHDLALKYSTPIVVGQYFYGDDNAQPAPDSTDVVTIYDAESLIAESLYQRPNRNTSVCGILYERRLFDDCRFPASRYEDLDIFYRLYDRAGSITVSERYVYLYLKHPDSFINSWSKEREDIIGVAERCVSYMVDRHPAIVGAARHRLFSAYFNTFNGLLTNGLGDSELAGYCWAGIKRLRTKVLFDAKSRGKNRLGALLSLAGRRFASKISRIWA